MLAIPFPTFWARIRTLLLAFSSSVPQCPLWVSGSLELLSRDTSWERVIHSPLWSSSPTYLLPVSYLPSPQMLHVLCPGLRLPSVQGKGWNECAFSIVPRIEPLRYLKNSFKKQEKMIKFHFLNLLPNRMFRPINARKRENVSVGGWGGTIM